jgi:hypothetical protein
MVRGIMSAARWLSDTVRNGSTGVDSAIGLFGREFASLFGREFAEDSAREFASLFGREFAEDSASSLRADLEPAVFRQTLTREPRLGLLPCCLLHHFKKRQPPVNAYIANSYIGGCLGSVVDDECSWLHERVGCTNDQFAAQP